MSVYAPTSSPRSSQQILASASVSTSPRHVSRSRPVPDFPSTSQPSVIRDFASVDQLRTPHQVATQESPDLVQSQISEQPTPCISSSSMDPAKLQQRFASPSTSAAQVQGSQHVAASDYAFASPSSGKRYIAPHVFFPPAEDNNSRNRSDPIPHTDLKSPTSQRQPVSVSTTPTRTSRGLRARASTTFARFRPYRPSPTQFSISNHSELSASDSEESVVFESSPWKEPLKIGKLSPRSELRDTDHTPAHRVPHLFYLNRPSDKAAADNPAEEQSASRSPFQSREAYPFASNPLGLISAPDLQIRVPVTEQSRRIANRVNWELAETLVDSDEDIEHWYQWLTQYANGQITISSYVAHPETIWQIIPAPMSPEEVERVEFFPEVDELIENSDTLCREEGLNFHLRRLTRTLGDPDCVSISLFTVDDEVIIASAGSDLMLPEFRRFPRKKSLGFHALLQRQGPAFVLNAKVLESHELFRHNEVVKDFHLKCYIAVPLYVSGHVVGVLSLYETSEQSKEAVDAAIGAMAQRQKKISSILTMLQCELRVPRALSLQQAEVVVGEEEGDRDGGGVGEGQEGPTRGSWLARLGRRWGRKNKGKGKEKEKKPRAQAPQGSVSLSNLLD